ncbi:Kinesin-Like Protein Kif6 [Manis pentadactyla]|nr:Kinesin-Like Protein Kif6 [Manis pentadactyla]
MSAELRPNAWKEEKVEDEKGEEKGCPENACIDRCSAQPVNTETDKIREHPVQVEDNSCNHILNIKATILIANSGTSFHSFSHQLSNVSSGAWSKLNIGRGRLLIQSRDDQVPLAMTALITLRIYFRIRHESLEDS